MIGNQDLLDDEVGMPPPSGVDIDAVIARQQRRVRFQQLGLAATAGAIAVAVAVVFVSLPRAGGASKVGAAAPPPAAVAQAPAVSAHDQEAARLSVELQQIMASTVPDAHFLALPFSSPPTPALTFAHQSNGGEYYAATAEIKDPAGAGSITVDVGREDTQFRKDGACSTDRDPRDAKVTCQTLPGPDGAKVEVVTVTIGKKGFEHFRVEIIRADGNGVSVDVSNGVVNPNGTAGYVGQRPTPSLTLAQVTAVAENPNLATTLP